MLLDDDPKASLPSACALQPWQSSRCSTWRRCCITADSSALADALSLVNSTTNFGEPTLSCSSCLTSCSLEPFVTLFSCVIPQRELPPRALPENVRHSLGEITLKRVDVKDSKPPERTVLGDGVERWCPLLSMLHFARFLSTSFELHALNSILLFTSLLSKLHFSAVLSILFFRQGVRIEPHVTFRVVFVWPNQK